MRFPASQQRSTRNERYAKISSYSRSGSPSGSVWSTMSAQSRAAKVKDKRGRLPDQRTPKYKERTSSRPVAERVRSSKSGGDRREGKSRAAARVSAQQVHAKRDTMGGSVRRGSDDIRSYLVRRDRPNPPREKSIFRRRGSVTSPIVVKESSSDASSKTRWGPQPTCHGHLPRRRRSPAWLRGQGNLTVTSEDRAAVSYTVASQ